MLILVKLQASACSFTKLNTPPWVFFTFFKFTNGTKSRNASHLEALVGKHDLGNKIPCRKSLVIFEIQEYFNYMSL